MLELSFWHQIIFSVIFGCALMFLVYVLAVFLDLYSIVDVAWSYSFGLLAILLSFISNGWIMHRVVFTSTVVAWSLRMGTHLLIRISNEYPKEDSRYEGLRKKRKTRSALYTFFFLFFEAQGIAVALLSSHMAFTLSNKSEGFAVIESLAVLLFGIGFFGEQQADKQLAAFKQKPENKGKVCKDGLWRYSRHPNYFFDTLVWTSWFLMASAQDMGYITVYIPLIMLCLFFFVTGIPPNERASLRSKPEAYKQYQQETSVFVPWFPKKNVKSSD